MDLDVTVNTVAIGINAYNLNEIAEETGKNNLVSITVIIFINYYYFFYVLKRNRR